MEKIEIIKRIAIIALFSDDELMDSIVLKGGNAIDLLQVDTPNSYVRASYDLDFSIMIWRLCGSGNWGAN